MSSRRIKIGYEVSGKGNADTLKCMRKSTKIAGLTRDNSRI